MNASSILTNIVSVVTLNMHKTRQNAVLCCVKSLLSGSAATVTSMGKDLSGYNDVKDAVESASNGDLAGAAVGAGIAVCKPCKATRMQQKVETEQAPKGIERLNSAKNSKDHVHKTGGTSMNVVGTVHDKQNGVPEFTNKEYKFLKENGWPTEVNKDDKL